MAILACFFQWHEVSHTLTYALEINDREEDLFMDTSKESIVRSRYKNTRFEGKEDGDDLEQDKSIKDH